MIVLSPGREGTNLGRRKEAAVGRNQMCPRVLFVSKLHIYLRMAVIRSPLTGTTISRRRLPESRRRPRPPAARPCTRAGPGRRRLRGRGPRTPAPAGRTTGPVRLHLHQAARRRRYLVVGLLLPEPGAESGGQSVGEGGLAVEVRVPGPAHGRTHPHPSRPLVRSRRQDQQQHGGEGSH